jgi:hypothetical protein
MRYRLFVENDDYRKDIKLPSDRAFGIFFSLVFGILSVYAGYREWNNLALLLIPVSLSFFAIAVFCDTKLHFLNLMWVRVGILIGKVTNPIILGIVFFGLFTPLSLFFQLRGRDELILRKGPKSSYWKFREPPRPYIDSFKDMF